MIAAPADRDMRGQAGRDTCVEGAEHHWVVRCFGRDGHEEVYCAVCMRCLGVEAMLRAYVALHGGTYRRG